MSPPPQHEADDYMNVHGHVHHHMRKHSRKRTRKFRSSREGSEGSRPAQRSLRSGTPTATSTGNDCQLCAAEISDGDDDASSKAPLIRNLRPPKSQNHVHGPKTTTERDGINIRTQSTPSSSIVTLDDPDSPAVNALRSFSIRVPTRSNSQGLQRVSTALANTLHIFRPNPTVSFATLPSRMASKKTEEVSRRSSAHSKSLAYVDINRRRPTFKDGKDISRTLEIPATITLRKASNVYPASPIKTSMGASLTHEHEWMRAADAPASELLAFYSSPAQDKGPIPTDLPSSDNAELSRSLKEQKTITFEAESPSFRRRSKSVSQFNDISNARRCSTPAEAALTFADVHVAPGSFAIGPKSRRQSLVTVEFSRRISTVQFRSHNSVHEVIWREDEKTSDSSLTASSGASEFAGHSFRSTPSPESKGSPTRELAVKSKETQALLPMVPESVSRFTKMPDNLFRWTWGASSAKVGDTRGAVDLQNDTLGQVAEATVQDADTQSDPLGRVLVINTSDPRFASLQQSSDQQGSRCRKPSLPPLPSVQSFPPLRPRSSTAEWQRAPLVDLNDPVAGRASRDQGPETAHAAGPGTDAGGGITGGKDRRAPQLRDTAGDAGWRIPRAHARVGLGIGASSHKRVVLRRKLSIKFDR